MKRIVQKATLFVVLAVVAASASRAEAAPVVLNPGVHQVSLAGALVSTSPGTLLDSLISPFVTTGGSSGSITGNLLTAVYQNASGFLDFYYQVVNTTIVAPGTNTTNLAVSGVSGFNFGGYSTVVSFLTSPFGIFNSPTPNKVPLSASRGADGNEVTFWFGPPFGGNKVFPGQTSAVLKIATNGRNFGPGGSLIQNSGTATVAAFQVPEPTTAAMALLGFLGLLGVRRRQQV